MDASHTAPALNLATALHLSTATLLLAPVLLTAIVAAIRWRSLRSRAGFLVLGILICLGVRVLAAQVGGYLLWTHFVGSTPYDQMTAALVNNSIGISVSGVVLGVPAVLWLARLLSRPDS